MRYAILIGLLIVVLAGVWWFGQERQTAPTEPVSDALELPEPRPEPRFPLPEPEPEPEPAPFPEPVEPVEPDEMIEPAEPALAPPKPEPLPSLADSDRAALSELAALLDPEAVDRWVRPQWIISRTVAMVHSLDGPAPAVEARPLALLQDAPQTQPLNDEMRLWTPATARRYADLAGLLMAASPTEAAGRYQRYYPLFQETWEELGETEPWFNDRLVDVIDHLLVAPEVDLPVEVVPFENRLRFADEDLEEESWGRKLLIRMGPEQAEQVRNWLREFRRSITGEA